MDELRKKSDKELKKIEDEIERIYKDAEDDLRDKWDKYMSRAEKRVEGAEKALQDAMKTGDADAISAARAALTQKKQAVFFRDKQFSEMVDAVTDRIANVNQLAADYVNGQMPAMYRYNYNGSLREVQRDAEASGISGIAFNMIDDATVERMQKRGEVTLPKRKIDVPKDKQWNRKAINAQMMQGIIQGESIPQMSKRLREVTDMNKNSSVRNARTMTTEAENGGRLASMHDAEEMGLEYEKTWVSTHDERTRLSHALIDGETVPLDEPFSNGLMYPADPSGAPEEVYNCFVGDTIVGTNSDVIRTYRHEYDGELVTIKTAGGVQFTCTPNHPILTANGWIRANGFHKGDDIFVTVVGNNRMFALRRNPHINHVLSDFYALHKFFSKFGRKRTCNLGVNFHGDIPTADVEIVTKKRFLRNNRNAGFADCINEFLFKLAYKAFMCKRTLMKHFRRIRSSAFGGVCSRSKPLAFGNSCLRHSQKHSVRPIALLNSGFVQKTYNDGARHAELLCNCLDGFSGMVFVDNIVSIDVTFSHCHVYNLQSENGYYFVNSSISENDRQCNNGIMCIAHNCRCSLVRKLVGFKGKRIDAEGYEPTYFDDVQAAAEANQPTETELHETAEAFAEEQATETIDVDAVIPENVRKTIDDFYDKFTDAKTEHYLAINKDGEVIFESGNQRGKANVSVPQAVNKANEGGYSIHNHPAPVTFSAEDIKNYEMSGQHGFVVDKNGNEHILYNKNPVSKYKEIDAIPITSHYDEDWEKIMPFTTSVQNAFEDIEERIAKERREYFAEIQETVADRAERSKLAQEWIRQHSADEEKLKWLEENAEDYGFVFVHRKKERK